MSAKFRGLKTQTGKHSTNTSIQGNSDRFKLQGHSNTFLHSVYGIIYLAQIGTRITQLFS